MKKRIISGFLAAMIFASVVTGCGNTAGEPQATITTETETVTEAAPSESTEVTPTETEATDDGLSQLEALGDVEVDKGLFEVTLTIPADFVGDTTQAELDDTVKERGYQSATLNADGSVTYVMTKAQHKEMLDGITEGLNQSLADMVGSEEYPSITAVTANDNFTSFTITTKNAEPDLSESFSVMALYMYGGMYAIFSGESVDNIHVDFVNADSGEIISSANSKDMGNGD